MTNLTRMWSQDLLLPGKKQLRVDILSRGASQARRPLEMVKLNIAAAAKPAYDSLSGNRWAHQGAAVGGPA